AAGTNQSADFAVEGDQSHTVLLLQNQVRQGRSDALGVVELGQGSRLTLIAHAFAGIKHEVADQVGLFLVLLEIELVGLTEDFPVDITQVVARRILAVFGKLDRKAMVGAAMQSRYVAFY